MLSLPPLSVKSWTIPEISQARRQRTQIWRQWGGFEPRPAVLAFASSCPRKAHFASGSTPFSSRLVPPLLANLVSKVLVTWRRRRKGKACRLNTSRHRAQGSPKAPAMAYHADGTGERRQRVYLLMRVHESHSAREGWRHIRVASDGPSKFGQTRGRTHPTAAPPPPTTRWRWLAAAGWPGPTSA